MTKPELESKIKAMQILIDKINEHTVYEMGFENHLQNNKKDLFKAYYRERRSYFKKHGLID